jgi:HEAT repeat protein
LRAVAALGRSGTGPEVVAFLSEIVRDSAADPELRDQAVRSLGKLRDPAGLSALIQAYGGSTDQRFRRRIIFAVGMSNDRKSAIKFLLDVAANGGDTESKRNAMLQLSQLAIGPGRRDRVPLDAETDVQREAVLAISRRPKDEAVPALINIARTHMKEDVRRQAIISLGRIGDDRAVEFFREQLSR